MLVTDAMKITCTCTDGTYALLNWKEGVTLPLRTLVSYLIRYILTTATQLVGRQNREKADSYPSMALG